MFNRKEGKNLAAMKSKKSQLQRQKVKATLRREWKAVAPENFVRCSVPTHRSPFKTMINFSFFICVSKEELLEKRKIIIWSI